MTSQARRLVATSVAVAACATAAAGTASAGTAETAYDDAAADPAVIARWSTIATRTIVENGLHPPVLTLDNAFASLAVHDAVAAVEVDVGSYVDRSGTRRSLSSEAAAATAAYEVLVHHFPASATALAADYMAELVAVDHGLRSGMLAGRIAAATIVAEREGDGR